MIYSDRVSDKTSESLALSWDTTFKGKLLRVVCLDVV